MAFKAFLAVFTWEEVVLEEVRAAGVLAVGRGVGVLVVA